MAQHRIRRLAALAVALSLLVACTSTRQDGSQQQDVVLQEVDGGVDYYARFSNSLPASPDDFVLGVWMESILELPDLEMDRGAGINTYVGAVPGARLEQLAGTDAHVLTQWPDETSNGFVVSDEVDMWAGPGDAEWTGYLPGEAPICAPPDAKCGYTTQQTLAAAAPTGQLRYSNFGKGVTFWNQDTEASRFVNGHQDVVSADNYWFTDPNICSQNEGGTMLEEPRELTAAECRRAANYGWTVDRVRSLVRPSASRPVWAFVEVGDPFAEPTPDAITPHEIRAAVWSSIIHGARGIVYFNHSFGGPCASQHVLRDCGREPYASVGVLNAQIKELAPALNAPTVVNGTSTSANVDVLLKLDGTDLVLIAASTDPESQKASIRVPCATRGSAEVLWEDRRVPVRNSTITDTFTDAEAVHVYQISGHDCAPEEDRFAGR